MKIYILRHGETEYNTQKRYQGTRDVPLSFKGRSELVKAPFCPERVYVSPLSRALETAQILFPEAEKTEVFDLREMCFGVFEGRSYIEMEKDADYIAWVGEDCMGRCPGGESRAEFIERSCKAFEEIVDNAFKNNEKEVVIVAHGGTQMAVMEKFAYPQKDYYEWCAKNGGGYLLFADFDEWSKTRKIHLLDEVCYMRKEGSK